MNDSDKEDDVYVERNCPICVHGFMRFTGQHAKDSTEMNVHRCIQCGYVDIYREVFPIKIE